MKAGILKSAGSEEQLANASGADTVTERMLEGTLKLGGGGQRTRRLQKKLERVKDPVKACRRGCASERNLLGRRDSLVG